MIQSYLARQPIFDKDNQLIGYELLYRTDYGGPRLSAVADSDATTGVIINSYIEIGLDNLVGQHLAFINVPSGFVFDRDVLPPPSKNVVLEIIRDDSSNDDSLAAVNLLRESGYLIALDEYDFTHVNGDIIKLAHYAKVDIKRHTARQLTQLIRALRKLPLQTVAVKVETYEEYEKCRNLGFDYYQGFFLCQPRIIRGKSLSANQLVVMKLLANLQKIEIEARELTKIIEADSVLTFKLLRYINSASLALNQKIDSINHAIVILGQANVRRWASLIALTVSDDTPEELILSALLRGKMCELLVTASGQSLSESAFLVGVFSTLDAIIGSPFDEFLPGLHLNKVINDALLYRNGPLARPLDCVIAFERGDWKAVEASGFEEKTSTNCYLRAVQWCDSTAKEFH